jgi:hypothetical protein
MSILKLSNHVTSDEELDQWCRRYVKGFAGVISRSDFPHIYKHLKPGSSIIINLDPGYSKGGTHWVALRISSEAPIIYYKDSFGAPPPEDITSHLAVPPSGNKQNARGIVYGSRINQNLDEQNCGRRAAIFLRKMANTPDEIEEFERLEK